MKEFEIDVRVTYRTTWIIEAESLAEAKTKAEGMVNIIDDGIAGAEIVDFEVLGGREP
jgi:hypothetical protein